MSDAVQLSIVKNDATPIAATAQTEQTAIIAMIERAARDPLVDLTKMERLFDMHKSMQARASEVAFNAAMADAQAELEPIGRQSRNTHTNSTYADLATVVESATPIIAKHGFGLSFGTAAPLMADHIRMVCDVTHKTGHTKRYESEFPYDLAGSQGKVNKTKIQAFGSTTTYGRRYMMLLIFNIATADNDGNAPRAARKSSAESKRDGTDKRFNELKTMFETASTMEELQALSRQHQDEINAMPARWAELLSTAWDDRSDTLRGRT